MGVAPASPSSFLLSHGLPLAKPRRTLDVAVGTWRVRAERVTPVIRIQLTRRGFYRVFGQGRTQEKYHVMERVSGRESARGRNLN